MHSFLPGCLSTLTNWSNHLLFQNIYSIFPLVLRYTCIVFWKIYFVNLNISVTQQYNRPWKAYFHSLWERQKHIWGTLWTVKLPKLTLNLNNPVLAFTSLWAGSHFRQKPCNSKKYIFSSLSLSAFSKQMMLTGNAIIYNVKLFN